MRIPFPLLFLVREVDGGGAKENLRDGEEDLVAVCGKSDDRFD